MKVGILNYLHIVTFANDRLSLSVSVNLSRALSTELRHCHSVLWAC